jgi:proline dehydrogenase
MKVLFWGICTSSKQAVKPIANTHTFYSDAMQTLLARGHPCSIATHDSAMLNYAHEFAHQHHLDQRLFEFEMLHGATPDRLKQMLDSGYRVRDYLPYGREWYLYVCHRLAEYPPNIYRALAEAVGDNCRPV